MEESRTVQPKIDPNLLSELKLISLQQGISMTTLVNLALKEFIISMDDDNGAYPLPSYAGASSFRVH
jgi:hypothetical protein